jgi:ATP-dependent Lon protease
VRHNVAMTGEITLRGRILPIGGLKEKVIAAHRAGIDTVLMPLENQRDIPEIPQTVLGKVKLIPVSMMQEVFAQALMESVLTAGPTIAENSENPTVSVGDDPAVATDDNPALRQPAGQRPVVQPVVNPVG